MKIIITIISTCAMLFIGALLIPMISFGAKVSEGVNAHNKKLTEQANNFEQYSKVVVANCSIYAKEAFKNPLPVKECECIVRNNLAHVQGQKNLSLSRYLPRNEMNLNIPKPILLDSFYRGNVDNQIMKIKLAALAKHDKNLRAMLEGNYFENIEMLIFKTGRLECSRSAAQDFSSHETFRNIPHRYYNLDLMNARINSVKKRHAELFRK